MGRVSSQEFSVHLCCGFLGGMGEGSLLQCKKYLGITAGDKGGRLPPRVIGRHSFNVVPAIDHTDDILGVAAIFLNTDYILIPAKWNPGIED